METRKLISMVEFVLKQKPEWDYKPINMDAFLKYKYPCILITKYAEFLKQTLSIGMFIPCSNNEPFNYSKHGNKEDFEKAKAEVIFEGFEYNSKTESFKNKEGFEFDEEFISQFESLEDFIKYNLTLTEATAKKLGV